MKTSGFLGPHPQNRYAELIPERYSMKVCVCVYVKNERGKDWETVKK